MEIMGIRYDGLSAILAGYDKTNIPLVGIANDEWINKYSVGVNPRHFVEQDGIIYYPGGWSDDIGSFYFIPKLARLLNINLDTSINLFYAGILVLAFLSAIWGIWKTVITTPGKIISIVGLLLLSWEILNCSDVYIASGAVVMALIPWWIYILTSQCNFRKIILVCLLTGIFSGISHYIRMHSGTGVLLFAGIIVLGGNSWHWKYKISFLLSISIGILAVVLFFGHLVDQRDNFLSSIDVEYQPIVSQHPFWHSVYIGFGYLDNDHGIQYSDDIGRIKVASIDNNANFLDKNYERILRKEIIKLFITDPFFIVKTILAKLRICLLYLLKYANVGLILAFFYPRKWIWQIAFGTGLGFSSLNALMVIPTASYLIGFTSFATLYGLYSIDNALANGLIWKLYKTIKKWLR